MGLQYFKRPVYAPGLQIGGGSTYTSDIVMSSTVSGGVGVAEYVQTISLTGSSTTAAPHGTINPRGVTFVTSTGTGPGWVVNLSPPGKKGIEKTIIWFMSGASTVPITVRTASSSQVLFGSTRNGFSMSTAAGSTQPFAVSLISQSSVRWAIRSLTNTASTYIPYFTSTASTA